MNEPGRRRLDDDALLALVGEVLDLTEPLDERLVEQVTEDAFALRAIDARMAELVADSMQGTTGVRSDDSRRTLVYEVDDVLIELELTMAGELHGTLQAMADDDCLLETVAGTVAVPLDHHGRFELVVSGPRLRLIVARASGGRVVTPWIFR